MDRLRRFINRNNRHFVDLRKPGLSRLRFKHLQRHAMRSKDARALVYVAEHNGEKEYLFPDDWYTEVAGGGREATELKVELFGGGLMEADKRGERVSYVVKRRLPDGSRPYFVVVRAKRKKPQALSPTLALAAPV